MGGEGGGYGSTRAVGAVGVTLAVLGAERGEGAVRAVR